VTEPRTAGGSGKKRRAASPSSSSSNKRQRDVKTERPPGAGAFLAVPGIPRPLAEAALVHAAQLYGMPPGTMPMMHSFWECYCHDADRCVVATGGDGW
jgi:hypothetical protein